MQALKKQTSFPRNSLRGAWMAQSVKRLPSAQIVILGSWDRVLHQAPCSAGVGGESASASPSAAPHARAPFLPLTLFQNNKSIKSFKKLKEILRNAPTPFFPGFLRMQFSKLYGCSISLSLSHRIARVKITEPHTEHVWHWLHNLHPALNFHDLPNWKSQSYLRLCHTKSCQLCSMNISWIWGLSPPSHASEFSHPAFSHLQAIPMSLFSPRPNPLF